MVGYMSLEERVDADFSRARRRAFLRRISARLRKGRTPNHLACFEEVSNKVGAVGGIRRGRRTVRLNFRELRYDEVRLWVLAGSYV